MSDTPAGLREIIFDTETTGLDPADGDKIIEIGALEMIDRIPTGRTFHHYIHPGDQPINPDAQAVHGISIEDLAGKPTFDQIVDAFSEFFAEGRLVAHNASFDMKFVNAELRNVGRETFTDERVVDTLMIARRKFPGTKNDLDSLCKRFRISNAHRTLHGALLDAELLQEVYIELTGGQQVGMALDAQAEVTGGSAMPQGKTGPARQRPNPLPDPRTEESAAAHAAFVETLGEGAVWHRLGKKAQ
jgi:DNA polymerase-3 subunit epsilon